MSYDNACKYLAENYPGDFVRWLLGVEVSEVEILKTELTLEPIRADSVIFLRIANCILHLEFQTLTTSQPALNFRMLDYSVWLKRQYKCPVIQILIFLQETENEVAFTEVYQDDTTTHHFRVVRLWEQNSASLLDNPALLPLASLTRTESPQTLLSQVAERVARIADREERQNIAGCLEILAGLRFDKNLIRQFLREDIMRESVIYQDIVQTTTLKIINTLIKRRFGNIDEAIFQKIRNLSTEKLDLLVEEFIDFSEVSDLVAWLDQQEQEN